MKKDTGKFTVHINRAHLNNFALGFDFYALYEHFTGRKDATVFMVSFLFFNITFTKWEPYVN